MKRIGILSFFPPFTPPRSGGELRLHNICLQLAARGFHLDLAAPTYGEHERETIHHSPNFVETRYPKTGLYGKLHRLADKATPFRECSALVCSLAVRHHRELREAARRLAEESDIYTHESPFLCPVIPRSRPAGQLLVYNSYNVEALMAADMFGRSPQGRLATRWIRRQERWLVRESDIVLACSEEDADAFPRLYGIERSRIAVVPNGVDPEEVLPCPGPAAREAARDRLELTAGRAAVFFIGSHHPPNIEAVEAILLHIAPALPSVDFLIAGKVCESFKEKPVPANVRLLGLVDEETRNALFHGCDMAINPMRSGSGTNLKMLDAMSAALPIVSTPFGARGLRVEDGRHLRIAAMEQFAEAMEDVLGDGAAGEAMGREARRHVADHFSWKAIGGQVADIYTIKTGRRVIVLSDYPVLPARHGGQIRAEAVAGQLEESDAEVTLLCLSKRRRAERTQPSPRVEQLLVPRSRLHGLADAVLARLAGSPADDLSAWLFTGLLSPRYTRLLRHELKRGGAVLLNQCYMERAARCRPRGIPLYYDAHNSESELKGQLYRRGFTGRKLVGLVRRIEHHAAVRSERVFAVSTAAVSHLVSLGAGREGILLCPNAVHTDAYGDPGPDRLRRRKEELGLGDETLIVFLGSGHPPNVEAARFLIGHLATSLLQANFVIIGSVCRLLEKVKLPENVTLAGEVDDGEKARWLEAADIAANPLFRGSGTSLKLFDYLAAGLPVVSTPEGIRGTAELGEGVLVVPREDFARSLLALAEDPKRRMEMARAARATALDRLDWSVALAPLRGYFRPAPE